MKTHQTSPSVSVVIPVYRAARSLEELAERLRIVLCDITDDYELILVDDASPDDSWRVIEGLVHRYDFVRGIQFSRNFGQHSATLCGLGEARGDFVVTMDDDLQNPPEEIPRLLSMLRGDASLDVVMGVAPHPHQSWVKRSGSALLNRLSSPMLQKPAHIKLTSFKVMRSRIAQLLAASTTRSPALGALLMQYTRSVANVEVYNDERKYGASGYTLARSVKLFLNFVMNNSTLPLKVVSWLGLGAAMAGLLLALINFIKYLTGAIMLPGFTTMVLLVLILNGLILFSLGVIGEYLLRILREVNGTPQYVVKEKI